jgi:ribonuclease G
LGGEIVINSTLEETRVALLEAGNHLAELYIERAKDASLVGNIYNGKIVKILPGMQSAFVDIGLERAAFLHVADVSSGVDYSIFGEEIENNFPFDLPIEDLLQEGQDVFVQVSKDPIGTKGARITSYITIPGRYLVLMPGVEHIGISRRITDADERLRLKDLISAAKPQDFGFIVRTASEGCTEEDLKKDIEFLLLIWESIQMKKEKVTSQHLVYSDLDLSLRSVRDLLGHEADTLIIDSEKEYRKIVEFVNTFFPELSDRIRYYDKQEMIFDAYGIELEIPKALGRRVWLKSGGYIVIDQTEALISIDVNTGKFVGKISLEDTILKTNIEAVKEVAYQIRLRNLGGIIIVDFIDMEKEENREKLFSVFEEAMKRDRAKCTILQVSELGLVEMTRKRVRESLGRVLCEPCPYCDAKGFVKSPTTVSYEILRELRKIGSQKNISQVIVTAHPSIMNLIYEEERERIEEIERESGLKIIVRAENTYHQEYFEVSTP